MQNPKENLPPAAVKNIQPLGPVRKWSRGAIKQLLRACSELYGPREEPCSLWARANTKMAPLGATLSLKVMTNRMCSVV